MIGIIIPPPEIKKLLEKTAEHVALNGTDFEKILIQREQHKPQFAFLKTQSPYRSYYDHRVAEISKKLLQGIQPESQEEAKVQAEVVKQPQIQTEEPKAQGIKNQEPSQQSQFLQKIFVELKEPEPDRYSAELPEKLSEGQQAIIQHTAQYSAKNGKNFLVALSEREKNNPQFQFLRTGSKNHPYFLQLVQAYTNVLQMNEEELARLSRYISNREEILTKCKGVFEYHMTKQQQARGKKEQTKQTKQSNIDWNDFELVQTISFDMDQNKNIQSGELLARIQKHAPMVPKTMEEKIISEPKKKEILQQCHVCRQNILASEMNKHLKTCLAQKKKSNNNGTAQQGDDVDIRRNLEDLSARRPDIFGTQQNLIRAEGAQNTPNSNTAQTVAYDGQAANLTRSTGSLAMLLYQQKKLKQELEKKGK